MQSPYSDIHSPNSTVFMSNGVPPFVRIVLRACPSGDFQTVARFVGGRGGVVGLEVGVEACASVNDYILSKPCAYRSPSLVRHFRCRRWWRLHLGDHWQWNLRLYERHCRRTLGPSLFVFQLPGIPLLHCKHWCKRWAQTGSLRCQRSDHFVSFLFGTGVSLHLSR